MVLGAMRSEGCVLRDAARAHGCSRKLVPGLRVPQMCNLLFKLVGDPVREPESWA